ncbi:hypothetical protein cce_1541 [Crocosphaera subtropica ATCC 51142]|uniref:Uncharacterized protein n=1 Tax=Crocosphaera subtropica (strain ATCC 51142 / BH68) TaxID=43989 RepID=B1WXE7_CROS5|nr:hypothetical protein cce_1541 [Crocosphaera subtropica ATCC 51142]
MRNFSHRDEESLKLVPIVKYNHQPIDRKFR